MGGLRSEWAASASNAGSDPIRGLEPEAYERLFDAIGQRLGDYGNALNMSQVRSPNRDAIAAQSGPQRTIFRQEAFNRLNVGSSRSISAPIKTSRPLPGLWLLVLLLSVGATLAIVAMTSSYVTGVAILQAPTLERLQGATSVRSPSEPLIAVGTRSGVRLQKGQVIFLRLPFSRVPAKFIITEVAVSASDRRLADSLLVPEPRRQHVGYAQLARGKPADPRVDLGLEPRIRYAAIIDTRSFHEASATRGNEKGGGRGR